MTCPGSGLVTEFGGANPWSTCAECGLAVPTVNHGLAVEHEVSAVHFNALESAKRLRDALGDIEVPSAGGRNFTLEMVHGRSVGALILAIQYAHLDMLLRRLTDDGA